MVQLWRCSPKNFLPKLKKADMLTHRQGQLEQHVGVP